jgi:hypothetical protein
MHRLLGAVLMTYEWKCTNCGFVKDGPWPEPCPQCQSYMRRKYRVYTPGPNCFFQPHWNRSVGRWVTSRADFVDALHRKGDEQSERLGLEHRYEPHDHGDRIGVTDDG